MTNFLVGDSYSDETLYTNLIAIILSTILHGMLWWQREWPHSDAALGLAIVSAIFAALATFFKSFSAMRKGSSNWDSCIMKASFSIFTLLMPFGQLAVTLTYIGLVREVGVDEDDVFRSLYNVAVMVGYTVPQLSEFFTCACCQDGD
jgi:hypothetical protein